MERKKRGVLSEMITAERLRELLHYDPETGIFIWRVNRARRQTAGKVAGSFASQGYWIIGVEGINYKAHRLAWLYVYGEWPKDQIDHLNGIKDDNRISNLRDVDNVINSHNKRIAMATARNELLGVSRRNGKWYSQIKAFLGYFDTPEEAHEAYLVAKRKIHPGCTL